jgi:hypothetical protein
VVIGKGIAAGGNVNIPASFADGSAPSGQLEVALEADGYLPVKFPVKDQATTLTQQCPQIVGAYSGDPPFTVTGHLQPGFAGATIKVKYTTPTAAGDPPSRTFERTVTTDANGDWTDTISPRSEEPNNPFGSWKVQARFDGDGDHAASVAPECTVFVLNDG